MPSLCNIFTHWIGFHLQPDEPASPAATHREFDVSLDDLLSVKSLACSLNVCKSGLPNGVDTVALQNVNHLLQKLSQDSPRLNPEGT